MFRKKDTDQFQILYDRVNRILLENIKKDCSENDNKEIKELEGKIIEARKRLATKKETLSKLDDDCDRCFDEYNKQLEIMRPIEVILQEIQPLIFGIVKLPLPTKGIVKLPLPTKGIVKLPLPTKDSGDLKDDNSPIANARILTTYMRESSEKVNDYIRRLNEIIGSDIGNNIFSPRSK